MRFKKGFSCMLMVSTAGLWYLFTSGEPFTKVEIVNKHHVKAKLTRDTVAPRLPRLVDTASFSQLERFEASKSDSFFNYLADYEKFNGVALFAHDGKVLYAQCFGYSDYTSKTPLTD